MALTFGLAEPSTVSEKHDRAMLWRIIWISLLLRSILATLTPLGLDEAYAIAVARDFSWSFFDHAPIGFWSAVFAANVTGIEHPLVFRLPALFYGTITIWLMFAIGDALAGCRAGLWAALLYALTPPFAVSGILVLPDGPMVLGSAIAVLWLVRNVKAVDPVPMLHWVFLGLGLALALASKYQAALFPVSTLGFMLLSPVGRRWFFLPGPYVAALIGLLGLAPVVLWNVQNDWASLAFHAGRTGDGLQLSNLVDMVVRQVVFLLPPVFVLGLIALWRGLWSGLPDRLLLALIALGPMVAFNIIYLFSSESLPHWSMPGWAFSIPLIGVYLAQAQASTMRRARNYVFGFATPIIIAFFGFSVHVSTGVLTRFFYQTPPTWDKTPDSFNYNPLLVDLTALGYLDGIEVIAARNWNNAGYISTGLEGKYPMRVLRGSPHHFSYMSGQTKTGPALVLEPVVFAEFATRTKFMLTLARRLDPKAQLLEPIVMERGGIPYLKVIVIRLNITK